MDVTVILGNSIIKDVNGWELTDNSNKVFVKSFRGATTSQMKSQVNPTTEQVSFYIAVLMISMMTQIHKI